MLIFASKKSSSRAIGTQLCLLAVMILFLAGCPVHQKPGTGTQFTLAEPQTNGKYYLYLPAGYDTSKTYPLVVTIHGLPPFDTADMQIREWQSTADKYGLIVIAPILGGSNQLMLKSNMISAGVKRDERIVINAMNHVLSHTAADPDRVLITAWSSGGLLMHYLANQRPDRFTALCSRGCWFRADILDEDSARRMAERNFPLMIFYGQGDSLNVKLDSNSAIKWYESMGFNVESSVILQSMWFVRTVFGGLGHDRRPGVAAEFFQRVSDSNTSSTPSTSSG